MITATCMYRCELTGLIFGSLRKNLAWWAITRRTTKLSKWGWAFVQGWVLARDNTVVVNLAFVSGEDTPTTATS